MTEESGAATVLVFLAMGVLLVACVVWGLSYSAIDAADTYDSAKLSFYDESPGCGNASTIGSGSCNSEIFEFGLLESGATLFCVFLIVAILAGFICLLAGVMDMNT